MEEASEIDDGRWENDIKKTEFYNALYSHRIPL
jgi:hypothetical protein